MMSPQRHTPTHKASASHQVRPRSSSRPHHHHHHVSRSPSPLHPAAVRQPRGNSALRHRQDRRSVHSLPLPPTHPRSLLSLSPPLAAGIAVLISDVRPLSPPLASAAPRKLTLTLPAVGPPHRVPLAPPPRRRRARQHRQHRLHPQHQRREAPGPRVLGPPARHRRPLWLARAPAPAAARPQHDPDERHPRVGQARPRERVPVEPLDLPQRPAPHDHPQPALQHVDKALGPLARHRLPVPPRPQDVGRHPRESDRKDAHPHDRQHDRHQRLLRPRRARRPRPRGKARHRRPRRKERHQDPGAPPSLLLLCLSLIH